MSSLGTVFFFSFAVSEATKSTKLSPNSYCFWPVVSFYAIVRACDPSQWAVTSCWSSCPGLLFQSPSTLCRFWCRSGNWMPVLTQVSHLSNHCIQVSISEPYKLLLSRLDELSSQLVFESQICCVWSRKKRPQRQRGDKFSCYLRRSARTQTWWVRGHQRLIRNSKMKSSITFGSWVFFFSVPWGMGDMGRFSGSSFKPPDWVALSASMHLPLCLGWARVVLDLMPHGQASASLSIPMFSLSFLAPVALGPFCSLSGSGSFPLYELASLGPHISE